MTTTVVPAGASTTQPGQARYDWVDVAKGLCMIAVVGLWVDRAMNQQSGWMRDFVVFAHPFRMPDFFLLSGLFVAQVVARPWRQYLDTKLVHYFYFLVLWTLVIVPASWLGGQHRPDSVAAALTELAWRMVWKPEAMLWFILMLPVFFIVTRLLERVTVALVLPLAALAMVAQIHTGLPPLDWFAKYYVYFYAGHVLSERVFELADWARRQRLAALGLLAVWAPANHWFTTSAHADDGAGLLVAGFAGIAAVVVLSSLLSPLRLMAPLRRLGSRSIVIYLGFFIPMLLILRLLGRHAPGLDANLASTLTWAGAIVSAWLVYQVARRTPLRLLYERPRWARLDGPARRAVTVGAGSGVGVAARAPVSPS